MSIKQEVYSLLQEAAPEGVTVRQSSQGVAAVLPAITFSAINTTNHRDLSGEIYSREASVQIDVWGTSSPETSELEDIVEEAMREAVPSKLKSSPAPVYNINFDNIIIWTNLAFAL